MPALRTLACPSCGHQRETKAGDGTRLRCPVCSTVFRAPPPVAVGEAVTPPAHTPAEPEAAASTGGVTVLPKAKPKVRQTARPRPRADGDRRTSTPDASRSTSTRKPNKPAAKKAPPPAPPVPAAESGRRGGLAYYGNVRRGRP